MKKLTQLARKALTSPTGIIASLTFYAVACFGLSAMLPDGLAGLPLGTSSLVAVLMLVFGGLGLFLFANAVDRLMDWVGDITSPMMTEALN